MAGGEGWSAGHLGLERSKGQAVDGEMAGVHRVSSRDPTHMTPSSLSGAGAQLNGRAMAAPEPSSAALLPPPPSPEGWRLTHSVGTC